MKGSEKIAVIIGLIYITKVKHQKNTLPEKNPKISGPPHTTRQDQAVRPIGLLGNTVVGGRDMAGRMQARS